MSLRDHLPNFQVRPASWEDVPQVVALHNDSAQDTQGWDASAAHWQRRLWHESGTALRQWAEARVRQQCDRAPDGARVAVHQDPFLENQPARELLATAGYAIVREFVFLRIDMHQAPPQPQWPEGIVVRPLLAADWNKVGPPLGEAFQDHWGIVDYGEEETTNEGEENPSNNPQETDPEAFNPDYFNTPGLCFVAWDGDEAIGSCLCNATTVAFPEAGYLGSLSIRPRYRRQGIGLALTQHALAAFYHRGTTAVITDTDGASFTGANHLYEKAGMSIFTRTLVHEKEIRPGIDLVKRTMAID